MLAVGWTTLSRAPYPTYARRAGHGPQPDPYGDEAMDVERAYQFVLSDPAFRVSTRPDAPLTVNAKRFIGEMEGLKGTHVGEPAASTTSTTSRRRS